jgi:poly(3-hydroxybutyrate) depolymerase
MLYRAYQMQSDLFEPMRLWANAARSWLDVLPSPVAGSRPLRELSAAFELFAKTRVTHHRPPFGIERVSVDGRDLPVREEAVLEKPFGTLLRFAKDSVEPQPKVLLVSPMACHFATLLRETARTMLPDHDVHITDWHNARDVPLTDGGFDLDSYIDYLIEFLAVMGPGVHVVAICQPCVATLAATALMAEECHPATPASLTLMAGPIDTRESPTEVNALAARHPVEWFERNVIHRVPLRYAGAGRRVYPGFLQLAGFMSLNPARHRDSFRKLHRKMAEGEMAEAGVIKDFYDEYFAVCDLPAEFYLQTMRKVFIEHHLPRGELQWRGRRVVPEAITRTRLLTVEGANDDICGRGQTSAALTLCSALPDSMKIAHVQDGAGHYGVFSGRRWQGDVYPLLRNTIRAAV